MMKSRDWRRMASLAAMAAALAAMDGAAKARGGTNIQGERGTHVTSSHGIFTISGGKLAGTNLFDSFSDFSLAARATARWTYSDPSDVTNVISRVTGGPSRIFGTLDSTLLPNAAFYFINPAGIVFGKGASVNVPGAAYFSTAQRLRFADGKVFNAATPTGSNLSMAEPSAFGFLGSQGAIKLHGVGPGFVNASSALTLAAANLNIANSNFQSGGLTLVAVGDQARSVAIGDPLAGAPFDGSVMLNHSVLSTAPIAGSDSDGSIRIGGGTISVNGGAIKADAASAEAGGDITIAAGQLTVDNSGAISSATLGAAKGGDINIKAAAIDVNHSSAIDANTGSVTIGKRNTGAAGNLTIEAGTVTVRNSGAISANSYGKGDAGNVNVTARSIVLETSGQIGATAAKTHIAGVVSNGDAGNIVINARKIELTGGGKIADGVAGAGDAGTVSIAAGAILIDGKHSRIGSNNFCTVACGPRGGQGGTVSITARGDITVSAGGAIDAQSQIGHAGNIVIAARDITVEGQAAGKAVHFSQISSANLKTGNAGTIFITGATTVSGGGVISTTSVDGVAGDIAIAAPRLLVEGPGSTITSANLGSGNAGTIFINGATTVSGGGVISTMSVDGAAGDIAIAAPRLLVEGPGSTITSANTMTGDAGTIFINATGATTVSGGGSIDTTSNDGVAGKITIAAPRLLVEGPRSTITSKNLGASGQAGNIAINATGAIKVTGGGSIADGVAGAGTPGAVSIIADTILVDGKHSRIGSNNFCTVACGQDGGQGGKVSITARGDITVSNGGAIDAQSQIGHAGDIVIAARDVTVEGQAAGKAVHFSQISSANFGTGNAGTVSITSTGATTVSGGGLIETTSVDGVAGDITIVAPTLLVEGPGSTITSANLGASGQAGNIAINATGAIKVTGGGSIADGVAGGGQPGSVSISADTILVDGHHSRIGSNNFCVTVCGQDGGQGGKVSITATGDITVSGGGAIDAQSQIGQAGDIVIAAHDITVEGHDKNSVHFSQISSANLTTGNAGTVSITSTGATTVLGGGLIETTSKDGVAGNITIHAPTLLVDGSGSQITSANLITGNAGTVSITSTGAITVSGGGVIGTTSFDGVAGNITIHAPTLLVDGPGSQITSANLFTGDAGTVSITSTGATTVSGGGAISTTSNDGVAGDITIVAPTLLVEGRNSTVSSQNEGQSGQAGVIAINAGAIKIIGGGTIADGVAHAGKPGSVSISADTILVDGHQSRIGSNNFCPTACGQDGGQGGKVSITATGDITVSNGGTIGAKSKSGQAGDIKIAARDITVKGRGQITSANLTIGNAGTISITSTGATTVSGGGLIETTSKDGVAGGITIDASSLLVDDRGSQISSANTGATGQAGAIAIDSGGVTVSDGGSITTDSNKGAAGNISLVFDHGGLLTLEGAGAPGVITTNSQQATAGLINVTGASAVILNGGQIEALGPGGGANVTITSPIIESSDRLNKILVSGVLTLDSGIIDVSQAVTVNNATFEDASRVLRGRCPALRARGETSQLGTTLNGPYGPTPMSLPAVKPAAAAEQTASLCGGAGGALALR